MDVERLYCADLTCLMGTCEKPCQNKESSKCNFCNSKKYYVNSTIIDKARSGDKEAQHHIILSLIHVIFKYAMKMQDSITPTIEFISIGNYVLTDKLQDALIHPNPCGYLLKCAKGTMIEYKVKDRYIIKVPRGEEPHTIGNIPDKLEEFEELVSCQIQYTEETSGSHSPLHEAIANLPTERARSIMIRFFGLYGQPEESIADIAGGDWSTKQYNAIKWNKTEYLKKIYKFLEEKYPEYVSMHIV